VLKRTLRRLAIATLIWVMARSGRVVRINWNVLEQLRRQRQGFLIGLWHNNILGLIDVMGRDRYPTMISRSRDGDDIDWVASRFGIVGVRGSPSAGGTGAIRHTLRLLAAGGPVIVTPDGPRGPRYVVKAGLVALARKTGAPVVPLACSAVRRWELGSWDRMKLPKPFAERVVMVGDPLWLDPAQADEATHLAQVQAALRELMLRVETFTGAAALFPDPVLLGSEEPPPATAAEDAEAEG
jgi:lysophospholipid acyltransferase (LPLAT)-like uncharacterized protein